MTIRHIYRYLAATGGLTVLAVGGLPAHSPIAPAKAAEALDLDQGGSTRSLYLVLIQQARKDGRQRAALAFLDDFDRQYPGDREARILRVNCLLDLGQMGQAQTALALIPATDRSAEAIEIRGHVLAAQERWPEAIAEYRAALRASPANPLTSNALGYALLRQGQPGEAIEALKGAYDLAPRNEVVRNNLALALTVAGRRGEADALLSKVRDATEKARLRQQIAEQAALMLAPPATASREP
ncbi:tetratricopeptide repeat protein [Novosphingobium aerophilum]|uniref:tetratricopeptide repeat protein n=1 Tax=Novosphingobium TaxID=165696 RepID=UPI0010458642|nr:MULTISPECIES: tetratricopeptide repeat protein [unclassified Novosphingobium]MPS70159.1 tetratricopeptide repeat protein [Novosphingobium sp.]TCM35242.1 tetratricopeptide repeat protein [Novosphingobium sp. ST904]WRT94865.1 tetratricopeptide repeat protein [Novosphingobium sp. RL4]